MIFVIGGTTGSGKSELAFRLAKAINGIIINGDAYALYDELNIGTAKPTKTELSPFSHFLFGTVKVNEQYSIYDYQKAVRAIFAKYLGKQPIIIVGGSGLYIRAALHDYTFSKVLPYSGDPYVEINNEEIMARLMKLDKPASERIHLNNRKRLVRALYIAEHSMHNKSAIETTQQKRPLFPHTLVILDRPKEILTALITKRTHQMMTKGLKEEAVELLEKYGGETQALQAIGYKEFLSKKSDEEIMNDIIQNTMRYTKRQRTFFVNQFVGVSFYNSEDAYQYLLAKYEEQQDELKTY